MERRTLAGIAALALGARVLAAVVLAPGAESLLASAHHEHASIAKNLAEGRGFRFNFFGDIERPDLTSQQAPLVPGLLAGAYLVFGVETAGAFWFVVALQIFGGAVLCAALADAVRTWSGDARLAVIAGVLSALYPPFVVAALHVQALAWNLVWMALLLAGAGRLREGARRGSAAFVAGAAGGLYTDPILAVVVAMLLGIVALRRERWMCCVRVGTITALAVAPWIARNYEVHGRFAFIKDSFPYVFWQGNTLLSAGTDKLIVDEADGERLKGARLGTLTADVEAVRQKARSINDVALSEGDLRALAALPNEAARMDWFGRRIRGELASNPWHYPRMCLVRLRQWAWFDETNPKSYALPYRLSYLVLAAGALVGLVSGRRGLGAFGAAGLALTAVHVLVITSARFRVSFELLLVPSFAQGSVYVLAHFARFHTMTPERPKTRVSPL